MARILENSFAVANGRIIRGYVDEVPDHQVNVYDREVSSHAYHAHENAAQGDDRHHGHEGEYVDGYEGDCDGVCVRGNAQHHHDSVHGYGYGNGHVGAYVYVHEHGHGHGHGHVVGTWRIY
jgi:hypothetical protein